MGPDLAYLPWTILLSGLGGFFCYRALRAGDRGAATRRAGWTLLPWGVYLVGLMTPLIRVADEVQRWATRFVFDPTAWIGLLVAVVAVALIGGGALWGRRGGTAPTRSTDAPPAASGTKPAKAVARGRGKAAAPAADPEQEDIEAILRRHGIS